MPELQEVRQDFVVDVADYLAGIREMIAAATELARADAEATAATRALSDELDSLVAPVADAAEAMSIAAGRANDLRDAMATAGTATKAERDAAAAAAQATGDLRDEIGAAGDAAQATAGATDRLTGDLRKNAGAAAEAAWGEKEFRSALLGLDEDIIGVQAGLHDYSATLREVAAMTAAAETEVKLL